MPKFTIEYISEKPKSKKDKTETKAETVKECSHKDNHRDRECSWTGCPIHTHLREYYSESKQCKFRIAKEVEGGMKELVKFMVKNGLNGEGKKLTEEEAVEIVAKLDKDELEGLTDQGKEWMASKDGQTEMNRKLSEKKLLEIGMDVDGNKIEDDDYWLEKDDKEMNRKGRFVEEDDEKDRKWWKERGKVQCGNCGAHNKADDVECWYCRAPMKQYDETEISDELIQYTIVHKDGKIEHTWLTREEYYELFKEEDITNIWETK